MTDSAAQPPFSEAAAYYARFRPPYARAAIDCVIARFGLGPGVRVLDLGCGPGTVAIPLSKAGAEVTAVDLDSAMLREGRRLAEAEGAGAIRWIEGRAEDSLSELGLFRVTVFGQSLHWMDRDRVLREAADHLEPGGGIAIIDGRGEESWEPIVRPILGSYFGELDRHPMKHPESAHEPSLRRSAHLADFTVQTFEETYERDAFSVLGFLYSCVGVSRQALGPRADDFESDLAAALAKANPSGRFAERTETAVYVAPKRAD